MPAQDSSFSTSFLEPDQRADAWQEALGQVCDVRQLDIKDRQTFSASIASLRPPGGMLLFSMSAGPSTLHHCFKPPSEHDAGIVATAFLSGRGTAAQGGGAVDVKSGDLVFRRTGEETQHRISSPIRTMVMVIPSTRLEELGFSANRILRTPLKVAPGGAAAASLDGMLRGVARRFDDIDSSLLGNLEEAILNMLGAVIAESARPVSSNRHVLRERKWEAFVRVIDRRLSDPQLRIADVADELHCSVRWLQTVLAWKGVVFQSYVLGARLDSARQQIEQGDARSITNVCLDHGFNDLSHFSRAFRRRFGVSPIEYRQRVQERNSIRS